MKPELRISAKKCSKRVLALVLLKVQDEGLSVSEAFAHLLDQAAEMENTNKQRQISRQNPPDSRSPTAPSQSS